MCKNPLVCHSSTVDLSALLKVIWIPTENFFLLSFACADPKFGHQFTISLQKTEKFRVL